MIQEVFEGLKSEGKIPSTAQWNSATFEEGFRLVDRDGNGSIDKGEI